MLQDLGKFVVGKGLRLPRHMLQKYLEWSTLRDMLHRLRINCVLDVGANQGQFARSLRQLGYDGHITSFEPVKKDFALLSTAFAGDRLWQGFNLALGNETSVKAFNVALEATTMSSFLTPLEAGWNLAVDQVEMQKLSALFDALIAHIAEPRVFLKIDTQGYDLEVVKGTESYIGQVHGLLSELTVLPTYENAPRYWEALRYYEQLGFRLVALAEASHDSKSGGVIEYDCLMIRPESIVRS